MGGVFGPDNVGPDRIGRRYLEVEPCQGQKEMIEERDKPNSFISWLVLLMLVNVQRTFI